MKHKFDIEKAREVILYIGSKTTNIYNLLKVIYYADKDHLTKYGRLIYGDNYIAMSHGPVPSVAYDLLKYAEHGENVFLSKLNFADGIQFKVKGYDITPCRQPNMDILSESDSQCLDTAIKQYGFLSFSELKEISHKEEAYKAADQNDSMPLETIIKSLPEGELLLDYVRNN